MDAEASATPRIIAGVDSSQYAADAADWAAALAVELGGALVVAHALDLRSGTRLAPDVATPAATSTSSEQRRQAGHELLARTLARISARHPGLAVSGESADGEPAFVLDELAAGADVLVTGTRGGGASTGTMLGSVSNRLAAHAPCPMIVIGSRPPDRTRPELVLGVGHKQEPPPVDFAFALASRLGLSVHVLRAFEPWLGYGESTGQSAPDFIAEMRDLLTPACEAYPEVAVTIEHSPRVAVPALVATGTGARMIVVGAHRRHGRLAFGPGHIVHGLLSHAAAPVAVVPIP